MQVISEKEHMCSAELPGVKKVSTYTQWEIGGNGYRPPPRCQSARDLVPGVWVLWPQHESSDYSACLLRFDTRAAQHMEEGERIDKCITKQIFFFTHQGRYWKIFAWISWMISSYLQSWSMKRAKRRCHTSVTLKRGISLVLSVTGSIAETSHLIPSTICVLTQRETNVDELWCSNPVFDSPEKLFSPRSQSCSDF